MSLRGALRSGVAAVCIAAVAAPAGVAAPAVAREPLDVRVAQAETFSRVEFHWAGNARATSRRDGQTVVIAFARDADPDIARLRTSPPRWIKTAEKRHVGGHLEVALTLTEDADAKIGHADGATYVNVYEKPAPEPAKEAKAETPAAPAPAPEPPRPNPVPPGGTLKPEIKLAGAQVQIRFDWANPAAAAVFRRGSAVWVVFDASADLDVSRTPRGLTQFRDMQAFRGQDYSAVRIDAAPNVPVFVVSEGSAWTVALGAGDQPAPGMVKVGRDSADGPAVLQAAVAGATRVIRLADPTVGDELKVVTALGPPKGLAVQREFVQLALLPSLQGLAVEPYVEDLEVERSGDLVRISREKGLTLSPDWAVQEKAQADLGAPSAASMPALIDYDNWPKTGEGGFRARYQNLLSKAAAESGAKGDDAPVAARMAFARFLVGSELSFEAIGVLNAAAKDHPRLLENAEFRGLRGIARVMARRYKEAQADFSAPVLSDDPSSSLWRAYIASQLAQWSEARTQFAKGVEAFNQFSPAWKARFARGDAEAALAQGDIAGAAARIRLALADKTDPREELATRLVQARIFQMKGDEGRALKMYQAIAKAPQEYLSAPALLRATQIQLNQNRISPVQAAAVFDGLRYRWRGDATELETIRALGQLYLGQGRYREALEALRSAGLRMPDLPEAIALQADLNNAFRQLFLDGLADGLEPIQALALFYDFKELTPIGADGDLMVRKLVRRLVDVDLLDQAADLLKYQADNRLDGVPKAQVSTDLALIYLMDRKPEQALEAINASRTTVLPSALNLQRRLIEARAWTALGRYDGALEIIEKDATKDAQDLRAEITWKQKDWNAAGPLFEKALGERWKTPLPLSSEDEGKLLRAGVAYSLAGDDKALNRLYSQYQGFIDQAHNPEALRIALSGEPSGNLSVADFGRLSADAQIFEGWVSKMKDRFRTQQAPVGAGRGPANPARQAQAGTAAKG